MSTSSSHPQTPLQRPSRRHRKLSSIVIGLGLAVVATGCSGGPGSKQDFIDVLQREDTLSEAQATCIADDVFDRYGDDENALDLLSAADSWEQLTGPEGIEGFDEFYPKVVTDCTNAGPTLDE